MAKLVDTEIRRDADKSLLDAFLYGQVTSGYKYYVNCETSRLSINFECSEDAVMFTLKSLDKVFNESFGNKRSYDAISNRTNELLNKYKSY